MNPNSYQLLVALIFCSVTCFSQKGVVSGTVSDVSGEGLPGVHIRLMPDSQNAVTNNSGDFIIKNLNSGFYKLNVSLVGFEPAIKSFELNENQHLKLNIIMKEQVTRLDEVTVEGKSVSRELKESVASVSVLKTKELYTKNNNTSDVIKQISGVNVRQTGGFGSDAEIYINGMSGKQVKFFLDGIPLSYFGSGLGLNVLPVNMMEQIEVYKGVVPVDLGADALGGGINIISRKEYKSYIDASYSLGSFNSHKINLNAQFVVPQNNFVVGTNLFYNYSDNDYKIDVEIPDQFGNPGFATVRRFHDRFSNYLSGFYVGVFDKKFADRLMINYRYSGLKDDIQHNAIMAQPYGEVTYDESTSGVSLDYEKNNILHKANLKWYTGFNATIGNFVDTTLNAYTWDGQVFARRADGGEISASKNLLRLSARNIVNRLNINYRPWKAGSITFNMFSSWYKRTGRDPVAAEFYGQDFYKNPTKLFKNAIGVAYEHTFGNAFNSYSAFKYFTFTADGYAIQNLEFHPNKQSVSNLGFSQSFRYFFTEKLLFKTSYEYATRLPDEFELFGDFTLVRPNPFLRPEQSHNANLALQYRTKKINADLNAFYRLTDNIIWLRTSQFFAQYQNLLKAMVRGFDVEVQYRPLDFLSIKANATYQDIRNRSPKSASGSVNNKYFNARLPNRPYLFGNGQIKYRSGRFLGRKNYFSIWWTINYVQNFFLFWAVDGDEKLKNTIPSQFIQNLGVSFALPENQFSVTIESANIFDRKAFDNFSVQRPGRAFYITLRTFINPNQK